MHQKTGHNTRRYHCQAATKNGQGRSQATIPAIASRVLPAPSPLAARAFEPAVIAAIFLAVFLFAGTAVAGPPAHGPARPPLVTVEAAMEMDVNPPAEFVGRVEAVQAVDLRARVNGFLEKVSFKEGKTVTAGDLLYVIEQAPYRAQVNADKARVAEARATLTRAQQYLTRLRTVRSGGVSETDIETAVSVERQAVASLQAAEATLETSEINMGYTTVSAPIAGRIGRTAYTRGNLVGPDSGALARIVQMDPIRVVYSISENKLPEILKAQEGSAGKTRHGLSAKPDQNASKKDAENGRIFRLRLPNGEILETPGEVAFMDNEVDSTTGTVAMRAEFDNRNGFLMPGQYVTVLVSRRDAKRLPAVPQTAVLEDREGPFVFVVDGESRVSMRRIETDAAVGKYRAVKSGLAAGETVIVQGVQKVQPGITVETAAAQEKQGGQS